MREGVNNGGMARGNLRIFLGAGPGAGKTFAMLEEGHRLRLEGADVVVGAVSVRGRAETEALLHGLERCPRAILWSGRIQNSMLGPSWSAHPPSFSLMTTPALVRTVPGGNRSPSCWMPVLM